MVYYGDGGRGARERKKLELYNAILSGAYEDPRAAQPGQEAIPEAGFSPEYVDPIGPTREAVPAREAVTAREGGLNMQNALGRMYREGLGQEALALQQGMEDRNLKMRGQLPSAVQETQWYTGQDSGLQKTHMALKRAPTVMNLGGNLVVRDPNGGGSESYPVTPKPEQMPEFKGRQAAAVESAKDTAQAVSDMPGKEVSFERNMQQVSALKSHPGKKYALGAYAVLPDIPGTEQKNFRVSLQQLKDTVFIENRQKLKGGGAITDFEGKKAENAEARLNDAQTEKAFDAALDDYTYWTTKGMEKLRIKAGSAKDKKYKLGETITKGGKQYIITKLNSDGNHDVMPVKK